MSMSLRLPIELVQVLAWQVDPCKVCGVCPQPPGRRAPDIKSQIEASSDSACQPLLNGTDNSQRKPSNAILVSLVAGTRCPSILYRVSGIFIRAHFPPRAKNRRRREMQNLDPAALATFAAMDPNMQQELLGAGWWRLAFDRLLTLR